MTYFFLKVLVIILTTAVLALAQQTASEASSFYETGTKLYDEGKFDKAIEPIQKAAELDPQNSEYHYGLGVCYFYAQRFEAALAAFTRFSELKPGAVAFNQIGATLAALGRNSEAIENYSKALKYEPDDPIILKNIGKAFVWVKKYKNAIEALERARSLGKDDTDLTGHLGAAYANNGHYKKALAEFQKLSQLAPDDTQVKYAIASVYGAMGNRPAAMAQQREVQSRDLQLGRKLFRQLFSDKVLVADELSKPK